MKGHLDLVLGRPTETHLDLSLVISLAGTHYFLLYCKYLENIPFQHFLSAEIWERQVFILINCCMNTKLLFLLLKTLQVSKPKAVSCVSYNKVLTLPIQKSTKMNECDLLDPISIFLFNFLIIQFWLLFKNSERDKTKSSHRYPSRNSPPHTHITS